MPPFLLLRVGLLKTLEGGLDWATGRNGFESITPEFWPRARWKLLPNDLVSPHFG